MARSNAFNLLLGLIFIGVLLISSQVSARELAESTVAQDNAQVSGYGHGGYDHRHGGYGHRHGGYRNRHGHGGRHHGKPGHGGHPKTDVEN
ncbi:abscisic acid and environmental stress-inducible protein-like [Mercurialis annua]|uniref:abscisic acid and environmental stress-inducible protein-like n=1 Tax=Mercurialis annua TaxID=3986 RepID=UPI00215FF62C|nr:abscisic acid and environmental stress-inducible protein-like [Mercurialis annua]